MAMDITPLAWAIIINLALANCVMIHKVIKEIKEWKNEKDVNQQ